MGEQVMQTAVEKVLAAAKGKAMVAPAAKKEVKKVKAAKAKKAKATKPAASPQAKIARLEKKIGDLTARCENRRKKLLAKIASQQVRLNGRVKKHRDTIAALKAKATAKAKGKAEKKAA